MKSEIFRFEVLCKDNKHIWHETAEKCNYTPLNALEEPFLNLDSDSNRANYNIIIYEVKSGKAVALFPGEISEKKVGPVTLRILKSWFGGLLVVDGDFRELQLLKDFVFRRIISYYYKRSSKIDYVEVVLPPKIMIENPCSAHNLVPFYKSSVEVNSILYVTLEQDLLGKFKYNVKWEIKKGLENINKIQMVQGKDKNILHYLLDLETQKASALGIEPIPVAYFEHILSSQFYYPIVAIADGCPVAALIYSSYKDVGTFRYNASNQKGKKLFINKGLLFFSMEQCRERGANYFLLGCGWEHAKDPKHKEQLRNIAFFKRSFSTHEATNYRFRLPLSYKGLIALGLDQRKGLLKVGYDEEL